MKFINNQGDRTESWGRGNIAKNGCGVVAAYNVLLPSIKSTTHLTVDFETVRTQMHKMGSARLFGLAGVKHRKLAKYLKGKCSSATYYKFSGRLDASCLHADAIILYCNNKGRITRHYMAGVGNGDGAFTWYNGYSEGKTLATFGDYLASLKPERKPIGYIVVNY